MLSLGITVCVSLLREMLLPTDDLLLDLGASHPPFPAGLQVLFPSQPGLPQTPLNIPLVGLHFLGTTVSSLHWSVAQPGPKAFLSSLCCEPLISSDSFVASRVTVL